MPRVIGGSGDAIETERLRLAPMGPALLRASLAGRACEAEALLGARLPEAWREVAPVLRIRLRQLEEAPALEPWLTRAVVLAGEGCVVGVAGFHGPPGGDWLRAFAPGGVEFGYTIFAPDRRRGYASEASRGLMGWASGAHGVRRFLLSIAPDNAISAKLAARLGFRRVGEWVHAERGLEHVWVRDAGAC
jgi:ribosomal-protein-alanine N-acetyltransferase